MPDLLIMLGVLIVLIGALLLLLEAFKESGLWGLVCLFIPPAFVVFALLHWQVSKRPLLIQLVGCSVMTLTFLTFGISVSS